MKILIIILIICCKGLNSFCQVYQFGSDLYNNTISPGELIIYNQTQYAENHFSGDSTYSIIVRIFPSSAMFNNARIYSPIGTSKIRIIPTTLFFPICGGDLPITSSNDTGLHYLRVNFDDGGTYWRS